MAYERMVAKINMKNWTKWSTAYKEVEIGELKKRSEELLTWWCEDIRVGLDNTARTIFCHNLHQQINPPHLLTSSPPHLPPSSFLSITYVIMSRSQFAKVEERAYDLTKRSLNSLLSIYKIAIDCREEERRRGEEERRRGREKNINTIEANKGANQSIPETTPTW